MLRRFGFVLNSRLTLEQAVKHQNLLVIDVRTPEEVAMTGKVPSAINIPIDTLASSTSSLGQDKMRPILFYCAKGIRSAHAVEMAIKSGYTNAYSTIDARSALQLLHGTLVN